MIDDNASKIHANEFVNYSVSAVARIVKFYTGIGFFLFILSWFNSELELGISLVWILNYVNLPWEVRPTRSESATVQ